MTTPSALGDGLAAGQLRTVPQPRGFEPTPSTHPSFPHLRGLSQPNPSYGGTVATEVLPRRLLPRRLVPAPRRSAGIESTGSDTPAAAVMPSPLAAFLRRYDVGAPVGFRPLGLGMLNRGYQVTTTTGRYFLKHYLRTDLAHIRFQHQVTAAMPDRGVPAVPPLADRNGRTVTSVNGRHFALFPWIVGRHRWGRHLSLAGAARIGRLLGRAHAAMEAVLPAVQQPLLERARTAEDAERTARRLLAAIRRRPTHDHIDRLAQVRLTERCDMLERLADHRPPDHEAVRVGYVHGDFHPLNVLHGGGAGEDEPVAVLDWDRVGVQPLTEELARAAVIYFSRGDGSLDLARVQAMVNGYHGVMRLPREEYARGAHRLWWERLTDFWMLEWRYDLDDPRCDPQYPAQSALVPWWTDRLDEVTRAFIPAGAVG